MKGKILLLVDDMVSTGGTLVSAARTAKEAGAEKIFAAVTHAVLAGEAVRKIKESPIDRLYITDTIPLDGKDREMGKAEVISMGPLLGEAIRRIHSNESISWLFRNKP